ncbi:site-specific DNA-methyltransferase [Sinomonas albida]|uniref:DNA-methyltransferase n=1 Tax=Sinomonas albida TaxID=369942 RepID=UPI0030182066
MGEPRNRILVGDALTELRKLETGSIDQCLTSPPYFRLRDYAHVGQLGFECHVEDWAGGLRDIAREVHRVLTPTGTFWLNLGDTYAAHPSQGAPRKSLLLAPERLARLLVADGWILRNKIIWAKPNPMPSSVPDRLTAAHEIVYVLAKQPRYFFDLDAVRIPHTSKPGKPPRPSARRPPARQEWRGPNASATTGLTDLRAKGVIGHPLGKNPGDVWTIPTAPGTGSHHAAFPRALAERCVLAGSPEQRCSSCRAPYRRPLQRLGATAVRLALAPTCHHAGEPEPGIVLDPFMGSGTTGLVASAHGRDWVGIELNPVFADEAEQRIQRARGSP